MKRIIIIILFSLTLLECHNADRDEIKRGQEQFFYFAALALYRPNFCEPPQLILEEGQTYNITLEPGKRFWFTFSVELENNRFINKKIRLTVNHSPSSIFRFNSIGCSQPINESSQGVIPKSSSSNQTIYEVSLSGSDVTDSLLLSTGDVNFTINYILF